MPAFSAHAPGKIILFGEHAVVYGYPAIAVPVTQVQACARIIPDIRGEPGVVSIKAPGIGLESSLDCLLQEDPIRVAIRGVMAYIGVERLPACTLTVTSTIPLAAGLGSGAAVSVAIIRALAGFLGSPLPNEIVSRLVYEVEKIHHGTPSGIDNTVVTYAHPVYFVKDQLVETFKIHTPFTIVIGDTGITSPTRETVNEVSQAWRTDPVRYEGLFVSISGLVKTARQAIEGGYPEHLGQLMDENHQLLRAIGVSSPELDRLVERANAAGALGAKLSGAGRGGNMIALVTQADASTIASALRDSGAVNTIITTIQNPL